MALLPDTAKSLYRTALVQGAAATTAIEGNTLTTEQIKGILDDTYTAPPSRAYQQREVRNVLDAFNTIAEQISAAHAPRITADLICEYNRLILSGTTDDPDIIVGRSVKDRWWSTNTGGLLLKTASTCWTVWRTGLKAKPSVHPTLISLTH